MKTKLIILRGPSGSGKSTIARLLKEKSSRNIATIEQDMFRHKILQEQENAREVSALMMKDTILTALNNDYDVIVDGIFNITHYKEMFDDLIAAHPDENYMYYFDISFDETVKRHQTRSKKNEFGEEEMKEWFYSASPAGYEFEKKIPQDFTIEETLKMVSQETALLS